MKTPCGEWISVGTDGPMLVVDSWMIPVDGDTDVLKPEIVEWMDDNAVEFFFAGYTALGSTITFKTDAGAMLFRMFWDDRVPR